MPESPAPLVAYGKKTWKWWLRLIARAAHSPRFCRLYAFAAVAVLLGTTLLWSALGAHLQAQNADQLSDPYMFESAATFHGASFPGSHSFLLKWPIFWLLSVVGITRSSLLVATVTVSLLTVAIFVFILYKIDKRPLVFGTICLALALVLLLVPTQAYAGGLLPVNMAMLTTRNLEYALYMVALLLFARARSLRKVSFYGGVGLLALLIASDKLFLSLSVVGSLLALLVYALRGNWRLTTFAVRWLVGSVLATALAAALLYGIGALHLTHLTNSAAATPYAIAGDAKNLVLGIAYSILGLLTNLGANPAYDNRVLSQYPGEAVSRLWSLTGAVYLVTFCMVLYALLMLWRFVWPTVRDAKSRTKLKKANLFGLSMVWSTAAAVAVFVGTEHYYAVDARYLTIGLFALVVVVSLELRRHTWEWPEDLLLIASTLVFAIGLASVAAVHTYRGQNAALANIHGRNKLVAEALRHHKVDVLVGDYWRVLPIKLASHGRQNVLPLTGCTQPATTLTSSEWQPDLAKHSFAYLATFDSSLTNFPHCSLEQIITVYGQPNATQLIAGTVAKPQGMLLFYDRGSHPTPYVSQRNAEPKAFATSLEDLPSTACPRPTIMNVVAHQDDDVLFLSPDLLHDIAMGRCVRTVYLTAGDSGSGRFYWIGRQLGAEAAYNTMLGTKAIWLQQNVRLADKEYLTVASPQGYPNISLIFFNLPDGGIHGDGFGSSHHQSLAKLNEDKLSVLTTVDGQSTFSRPGLVSALSMIMAKYQPAEIHTQANIPSAVYPDHSDHITTGLLASEAAETYDSQRFGNGVRTPIVRYIGYPIHGYEPNVLGEDLAQKEAAFFAYSNYDNGVCHSIEQCRNTATYGAYITRQYTDSTLSR